MGFDGFPAKPGDIPALDEVRHLKAEIEAEREARAVDEDQIRELLGTVDDLRAELAAERERATVLQSRLRYIANYIEGRVRAHIAIADDAGSTVAGKKHKVRASEASEILGMVRKEITYD